MELCLNKVLYAFSYALDCVEQDYFKRTSYHGKRVAYLTMILGEHYPLSDKDMSYLIGCAILHDNGMSDYYKYGDDLKDSEKLKIHCLAGEKNMQLLPFYSYVKDVILHHHEMANGNGPFRIPSGKTPLYAQLIHIVDYVDVHYSLTTMNNKDYKKMIDELEELKEIEFTSAIVEKFKEVITFERIEEVKDNVDQLLKDSRHNYYYDFPDSELLSICQLFARIIDNKSPHTRTHSVGVATCAAKMGIYYEYDEDMIMKLFFTGVMHDVGKLVISRDILEKPSGLTDQEYTYIQTHAYYSYQILNDMEIGDIVHWSSFHHEKLDGSGYPFGKKASELDFIDRLMACCDIYQALTENRPYKEAMTHQNAIDLMIKMAESDKIDIQIVKDMNQILA